MKWQALRLLAALLTALSGAAQIAALWFRELDDAALLDALSGSIYLILALGLLGLSRFSLFLGIALPTSMAALALYAGDITASASQLRLGVDLTVPLLCALLLLARLRSQQHRRAAHR